MTDKLTCTDEMIEAVYKKTAELGLCVTLPECRQLAEAAMHSARPLPDGDMVERRHEIAVRIAYHVGMLPSDERIQLAANEALTAAGLPALLSKLAEFTHGQGSYFEAMRAARDKLAEVERELARYRAAEERRYRLPDIN